MTDTDRLLDLIDDKSTVTIRTGSFVGIADGRALIDLGGNRFPVAFSNGSIPTLNDPVNVCSVDGTWYLLGPSQPKPNVGTVITVSTQTLTLQTSVGIVTAIIGGTPPSSGDRVTIQWTEDGAVSGLRLATTPTLTAPPNTGGGGSVVKEATFRAIDAGSTDRGAARWWQAQPWASNSTYGAWFYGTQIKSTIPSGSTPISAEIYINRVQDQGDAPRFALHTSPTKGGVPTMSAYVPWDLPNGWNTLPAGWFEQLMGGGGYFGIGLNQGGYNKFASLAEDGLSGALRMKWR